MNDIKGQMTLDGFKDIKPLIYSCSMSCLKTICPYCRQENPDSTDPLDCTKRDDHKRMNKNFYPFYDLPLNFCPTCGKEFDRDNCEVRMTKEFEKANPEYVKKLHIDEQGRKRERKSEDSN